MRAVSLSSTVLILALSGCVSGSDDGSDEQAEGETGMGDMGDGDGGTSGDGDGDTSGDGDGDTGPGPLGGPFTAPNGDFCGSFDFTENLGPDYDTALAAFEANVAETYPSHYLQADPIEDPVYDWEGAVVERDFWLIHVLDSMGGTHLYGLTDILDSEGNRYFINWCPD